MGSPGQGVVAGCPLPVEARPRGYEHRPMQGIVFMVRLGHENSSVSFCITSGLSPPIKAASEHFSNATYRTAVAICPGASHHRCHRASVRAIEEIRYVGSVGSLSLALTFSWLRLHSAISMSSRTLPKYFA